MLKDLAFQAISSLIPEEYLNRKVAEQIEKQVAGSELGWTTITNVLSPVSKLGSISKQLDSYQNHIYKIVTVIKNRVTSIPWNLVYKRGREFADVDQHPFYDLADHPNNIWSFQEMLGFAIMQLDLCGRSFWWVDRDGLGAPTEIWPLNPANFDKMIIQDRRIVSYRFFDNGKPISFPAEDIIDFRYQHPAMPFHGASPVQQMALSYDTDWGMRHMQRNFFERSARPDMVFETDQKPSPETIQAFLLKWKEAHQGVDKMWQPAVLAAGMKAHVLNISNQDMALIELMGFTKQDLLEAYAMPEGSLGTMTDINRANGLAINIVLNENCILPRLTFIAVVIGSQLLPLYDPGLKFKFDNPVPRDIEQEVKVRESNLKSGYTVINEERAKKGLDPKPWGDEPWFPLAWIQPSDPGTIPTPTPQPKGITKGLTNRQRQRFHQTFQRQFIARSIPFQKWLERFFADLGKEVNANIGNQFKRIEGITGGMSISKLRTWMEENKDVWESVNFNLSEAEAKMAAEGVPFIESVILQAGDEMFDFLGVENLDFDIANPRIIETLATRKNLLSKVPDDLWNEIRDQLTEGIELGESATTLQNRIRGVTGLDASQVRALRIARTEAATASNAGNHDAYVQSGLVEKHEWLTAGDSNVREDHQATGAKYTGDGAIPINEKFEVPPGSGNWTLYPGGTGVDAQDINERCADGPVVREIPDE